MLTLESRCDMLDAAIAENRLIRQQWIEKNGVDRVCLLAALSPECAKELDAGACPATVCPKWWAILTPWIDDSGSLEQWPRVVREYAALARQWSKLSAAQWERLEWRVKLICVEVAEDAVTRDERGVRNALAETKNMLKESIAGVPLSAAAAAAWAAGAAGAAAAAWAAKAAGAAAAAWAAGAAKAAKAAEAAEAAAAAGAAWAAGAAAAAGAAGAAGAAKAADKIIDKIFAAMREEISLAA